MRYTGMSLGYQLSNVIGSGLMPLVATLLLNATGTRSDRRGDRRRAWRYPWRVCLRWSNLHRCCSRIEVTNQYIICTDHGGLDPDLGTCAKVARRRLTCPRHVWAVVEDGHTGSGNGRKNGQVPEIVVDCVHVGVLTQIPGGVVVAAARRTAHTANIEH